MDIIAEFKGQNGKIIVHNDYLVISKKTFGGFLSQGGSSGDRRYYYKDLITLEYKKPTIMANGYYKAIVQGTVETNAKVGLFSSSMSSAKDQNTIILRAFTKKVGEETDRIYNIIMQKISEAKKEKPAQATSSKMDELKKLGDLKASGIITDEQFQKEKEKLLRD